MSATDDKCSGCGKPYTEVSLAHVMSCVGGLDEATAETIQRGTLNRLTVLGLGRCDVCDGDLYDDYECPEHGTRRRSESYADEPIGGSDTGAAGDNPGGAE